MGGVDKGAIEIGGERLIDRVISRIKPQAERILISARHDYGTGLTALPDRDEGPAGPAAGLWAAVCWLGENAPAAEGFLTAPVDGPFAPADLYARLAAGAGSAVARNSAGVHPTFAYWRVDALRKILARAPKGEGLSLKRIATEIGARETPFSGADQFININTPEEKTYTEQILDNG